MTSSTEYRATEPIRINGVLAFNVGHRVPAGHVTRYGLDKQVEKIPVKEAAGGTQKGA